jgi:hypothetical protein
VVQCWFTIVIDPTLAQTKVAKKTLLSKTWAGTTISAAGLGFKIKFLSTALLK